MNSSDELLSFDRISARYANNSFNDRNALEDVTFSLPAAAGLVSLIGPNGCGKTTVLRVITGQLQAIQGTIRLAGRDVTNEPTHKRTGLSCVFQRAIDGMCASLTVEENLSLMLMGHGPSLFRPLVTPGRTSRLLERAQQLVPKADKETGLLANLRRVLHKVPTEFSGGEIQQLCLLSVLLQEPPARLVLADEPTLNLDKANRAVCLDMLLALSKTTTVLIATHDRELIAQSARVVMLDQGRLARHEKTPDSPLSAGAT